MNKVKLIIVAILFCGMGYMGFSTYGKIMLSDAEKFALANIEALTDNESGVISLVMCRCHTDLNCYGGNAISFRPSCAYPKNGYGDEYGDCRSNDDVCRNLH